MSTLAVRSPHAAKLALPLRGFAHVASFLAAVLEILDEARRQAYAAKQRYPFIDW